MTRNSGTMVNEFKVKNVCKGKEWHHNHKTVGIENNNVREKGSNKWRSHNKTWWKGFLIGMLVVYLGSQDKLKARKLEDIEQNGPCGS